MDLSFTRFDADAERIAMPKDLAVLMVGIAARQAASPTAAVQAGFVRLTPYPRLFAPLDGAFNGAAAGVIARWSEEPPTGSAENRSEDGSGNEIEADRGGKG